jgi:hypothetical protein
MRTAKAKTIVIKEKKIAVTESNVRKTATRLLSVKLVSTEIAYVQRVLGNTATQSALDAKVMAVRSMPWASIVVPE